MPALFVWEGLAVLRTALILGALGLSPLFAAEPVRVDFLELNLPPGWTHEPQESATPPGYEAFSTQRFKSPASPPLVVIVSAVKLSAESLSQEQANPTRAPGLAPLGLVMPVMNGIAKQAGQESPRHVTSFDMFELGGALSPSARGTLLLREAFVACRAASSFRRGGRGMYALLIGGGKLGEIGTEHPDLEAAYGMLREAKFDDPAQKLLTGETQEVAVGPLRVNLPADWTVANIPARDGQTVKRIVSTGSRPLVLMLGSTPADAVESGPEGLKTYVQGVNGGFEFDAAQAVYDWDRVSLAGKRAASLRCLLPTQPALALHQSLIKFPTSTISLTVVTPFVVGKVNTDPSLHQAIVTAYRALHAARMVDPK